MQESSVLGKNGLFVCVSHCNYLAIVQRGWVLDRKHYGSVSNQIPVLGSEYNMKLRDSFLAHR